MSEGAGSHESSPIAEESAVVAEEETIVDESIEELPSSNNIIARLENLFKSYGLTPFSCKIAVEFIKKYVNSNASNDEFPHLIPYLLDELNGRSKGSIRAERDITDWQCGCPNRINGLRSAPFWDKSEFSWISILENSVDDIKNEFFKVRQIAENNQIFQHYTTPTAAGVNENQTSSGRWNVCYLYLHGVDFTDNLDKFPITKDIINRIPRHYSHAFFSALAPGTHIIKHFGPTNKKLRIHIPLIVPSNNAWLRVADVKHYLKEGEIIIFDDSHEHEAANDSVADPRVVLVIDIWHPDLTDKEIKFFQFINNQQIIAAKRMHKQRRVEIGEEEAGRTGEEEAGRDGGADGNDFLTAILNARSKSNVPVEEIWGHKVIDD